MRVEKAVRVQFLARMTSLRARPLKARSAYSPSPPNHPPLQPSTTLYSLTHLPRSIHHNARRAWSVQTPPSVWAVEGTRG